MVKEITIGKLITWIVIGFILIMLFFSSIYTIKAGQSGVLLTFGKLDPVAKEQGLHIKFPIAQKLIKFEVRTQKIEVAADSASKDLQDVQTTIALNYHLDPPSTPQLYQNIGPNYQTELLIQRFRKV